VQQEHSLKKRYFYKLFTNFLGLGVSLVTQIIVPRGLGPKSYGDFSFLSDYFNQLAGFFDMGTSIGFYTKLSQRPKEFKLVVFYFYFIAIASLLLLAFVVVAHTTKMYTRLWPGQELFYIYLAAFLGIFVWLINTMNRMTDAYALTVSAELGKVFQKLIGVFIIIMFFVYNKLNLGSFFFYNYFIHFLLLIVLACIMKRSGYSLLRSWKLTGEEIKNYTKEFYQYSHPLFIYSLVGLFAGIFDRWLLQVYGGSIQQGFFGLSYQIGAVCFLFSSAMTPLVTREFSIAYNNKDLVLMATLFRKHIPLLYSITAFLACFVAVNADKVTHIIGGGKFKDAAWTVSIMAFYPIHQTYGQLSGSVFYATGQTRLYRNIGVVFMLIGLPVTYLLVAHHDEFGINSGATGLAIKMILLLIVAVNVQLYFNAKFLKLSFLKYLGHQIFSVSCLVTIAAITNLVVDQISVLCESIILRLLLSGIFYTIIVVGFVYCIPVTFGLKRQNIQATMQLCTAKIMDWTRYRK
jgi:O-antigen/teichoic acid export membrane protein